ncbi:MAG TPA: helix-turn-helix transcriptional regulator [Streptosporangiaceae bacterium]
MRRSTATERARQAIGRLPAWGAPWPVVAGEVIAQLRRVVGFDSFCASQNDPRTAIPAAALADNDAISGRQRLFWQIEMQRPDVNKTGDLVRASCPAAVLSAATGGDLARSARWDELLRPGGIGDELRVALVADGRWWGSVSLYRERQARWFTSGDAAAVAGLAGPIATLARASWTAGRGGPGPGEDPPGTVLVTDDGREVTATSAARHWLDRLDPVQRASGTLIYALVARLGAVRAPYGRADSVRSLVRAVDGGWIELDASGLESPAGAGSIAITVQAASPAAVTELLMDAFALTARERQVAGLALAGRSTGQIGAELFLSRHTAADHLKAIFAKTGVHTRAELAQRLAGPPG